MSFCSFVQLTFEGIRGSSYTGDAAIDNVVLRECGGGGGCGKFLNVHNQYISDAEIISFKSYQGRSAPDY